LFLVHSNEVKKHVIQDSSRRLLVLERRNRLAQYVSLKTAEATGKWNMRASEAPGQAPIRVAIDEAEFGRWLELMIQRYERLRERLSRRQGVLYIESESLEKRFGDILDFLGVQRREDLPVVRGRQNQHSLVDCIQDPDRLRRWLESRGLESWLA
jgi:hypothetical protein